MTSSTRFTPLAASAVAIAASLLAGCHAAPPAAAVRPDPRAALVASLAGVWKGRAEGTPFGDFPMALDFARRPDGALHARLASGPDFFLDFTFHRRDGAWLLTEQGALPKVGVQQHTLAPSRASAWSDAELDVELATVGGALIWTTVVRGKPHSVFRLHKVEGAEAAQIRAALARQPQ